ncbi:uncharacterized protein RB166_007240 [Leptodactylus fuscus]|uniref:uncharacterized protein LOC142182737 n=1 Tax=Leptodactylus fuscus TaxID=238119 RepID=UPI003F4F3222
MAAWNNPETGTPRNTQEEPQTLSSTLSLSHLKLQEPPDTNGEDGLPRPGPLRNTEEELEKIGSLLESNIEALSILIVQVCQYSNKPTQDAPGPARKHRSLKELKNEFQLKMEQLKQAVAALSSNGPPNHFSVDELYTLILHIKSDDWIHLMRVLLVEESEMEACRRLYPNLREQKYQMLQIWLNKSENGMRTHRDHLVEALVLIEYDHLASLFRNKSTRSAPPLRLDDHSDTSRSVTSTHKIGYQVFSPTWHVQSNLRNLPRYS